MCPVTVYIFDFDGTLAQGDSVFRLWRWAVQRKPERAFRIARGLLRGMFGGVRRMAFDPVKEGMLSILDDLSASELERFADAHLRERGYGNLLAWVRALRREADRRPPEGRPLLILCTASPEAYMRYIAQKLGFDVLMATAYADGKLIGHNNAGEEKGKRLAAFFAAHGINPDASSIAVTDSPRRDREMAKWAQKRYLVNGKAPVDGYERLEGRRF